jgi:hypothetical protein
MDGTGANVLRVIGRRRRFEKGSMPASQPRVVICRRSRMPLRTWTGIELLNA